MEKGQEPGVVVHQPPPYGQPSSGYPMMPSPAGDPGQPQQGQGQQLLVQVVQPTAVNPPREWTDGFCDCFNDMESYSPIVDNASRRPSTESAPSSSSSNSPSTANPPPNTTPSPAFLCIKPPSSPPNTPPDWPSTIQSQTPVAVSLTLTSSSHRYPVTTSSPAIISSVYSVVSTQPTSPPPNRADASSTFLTSQLEQSNLPQGQFESCLAYASDRCHRLRYPPQLALEMAKLQAARGGVSGQQRPPPKRQQRLSSSVDYGYMEIDASHFTLAYRKPPTVSGASLVPPPKEPPPATNGLLINNSTTNIKTSSSIPRRRKRPNRWTYNRLVVNKRKRQQFLYNSKLPRKETSISRQPLHQESSSYRVHHLTEIFHKPTQIVHPNDVNITLPSSSTTSLATVAKRGTNSSSLMLQRQTSLAPPLINYPASSSQCLPQEPLIVIDDDDSDHDGANSTPDVPSTKPLLLSSRGHGCGDGGHNNASRIEDDQSSTYRRSSIEDRVNLMSSMDLFTSIDGTQILPRPSPVTISSRAGCPTIVSSPSHTSYMVIGDYLVLLRSLHARPHACFLLDQLLGRSASRVTSVPLFKISTRPTPSSPRISVSVAGLCRSLGLSIQTTAATLCHVKIKLLSWPDFGCPGLEVSSLIVSQPSGDDMLLHRLSLQVLAPQLRQVDRIREVYAILSSSPLHQTKPSSPDSLLVNPTYIGHGFQRKLVYAALMWLPRHVQRQLRITFGLTTLKLAGAGLVAAIYELAFCLLHFSPTTGSRRSLPSCDLTLRPLLTDSLSPSLHTSLTFVHRIVVGLIQTLDASCAQLLSAGACISTRPRNFDRPLGTALDPGRSRLFLSSQTALDYIVVFLEHGLLPLLNSLINQLDQARRLVYSRLLTDPLVFGSFQRQNGGNPDVAFVLHVVDKFLFFAEPISSGVGGFNGSHQPLVNVLYDQWSYLSRQAAPFINRLHVGLKLYTEKLTLTRHNLSTSWLPHFHSTTDLYPNKQLECESDLTSLVFVLQKQFDSLESWLRTSYYWLKTSLRVDMKKSGDLLVASIQSLGREGSSRSRGDPFFFIQDAVELSVPSGSKNAPNEVRRQELIDQLPVSCPQLNPVPQRTSTVVIPRLASKLPVQKTTSSIPLVLPFNPPANATNSCALVTPTSSGLVSSNGNYSKRAVVIMSSSTIASQIMSIPSMPCVDFSDDDGVVTVSSSQPLLDASSRLFSENDPFVFDDEEDIGLVVDQDHSVATSSTLDNQQSKGHQHEISLVAVDHPAVTLSNGVQQFSEVLSCPPATDPLSGDIESSCIGGIPEEVTHLPLASSVSPLPTLAASSSSNVGTDSKEIDSCCDEVASGQSLTIANDRLADESSAEAYYCPPTDSVSVDVLLSSQTDNQLAKTPTLSYSASLGCEVVPHGSEENDNPLLGALSPNSSQQPDFEASTSQSSNHHVPNFVIDSRSRDENNDTRATSINGQTSSSQLTITDSHVVAKTMSLFPSSTINTQPSSGFDDRDISQSSSTPVPPSPVSSGQLSSTAVNGGDDDSPTKSSQASSWSATTTDSPMVPSTSSSTAGKRVLVSLLPDQSLSSSTIVSTIHHDVEVDGNSGVMSSMTGLNRRQLGQIKRRMKKCQANTNRLLTQGSSDVQRINQLIGDSQLTAPGPITASILASSSSSSVVNGAGPAPELIDLTLEDDD